MPYSRIMRPTPSAQMRVRALIRDTARDYETTIDEVLGPCREAGLVQARNAAIRSVASEFPWLRPTQLGRIFNRHHSTILYALGRVSKNRPDPGA